MRRLLALVLTAGLLAGSAGAVWSDAGDHWAGEALERAGSRGWLSGYEDGTVRPDDALTWGHYLTMLGRAFWPDALAQTPPEAEGGHWASGPLRRRPGATGPPAPGRRRRGPGCWGIWTPVTWTLP